VAQPVTWSLLAWPDVAASGGGTGYSFGDTPAAEERLDLLAAVFDPPSRAFLASVVSGPPRLACDLGCGPGNTTRMIRDVTGASRVIGLDRSAAFASSARARSSGAGDVEFQVWEAGTPLPVAAPDLVYARMLLAHLTDPARLAAAWASQLGPGGQLLLDEVHRIGTRSEVFAEYLDIVVQRVRAGGAEMYAGPLLDAVPLPDGCQLAVDQVVAHPVPARDAARLFRLNLSVWGGEPWALGRFGEQALARLDHELGQLAAGRGGAPSSPGTCARSRSAATRYPARDGV
jgi:trans-aconitate 2-methyltransferase